MRSLLLAGAAGALLAACPATTSGQQRVLVNTDRSGLALQGYDPVAYFTAGMAMPGRPELTASYQGATYQFATPEHRDRFRGDPGRYAPQFGGYCGYGASRGYLAPVDPEAFVVMDGRLILQNSKRVLELWQREPEARLKLADANWPGLLEREGKPRP